MVLSLCHNLAVVILFIIFSTCTGTNCTNAEDCKNGGTCPTPLNSAPCNCTTSVYRGDTCEDACDVDADCGSPNGKCHVNATSGNTCQCFKSYTGTYCEDACDEDGDCFHSGKCSATSPKKCTSCGSGYSGDLCQNSGTHVTILVTSLLLSLLVAFSLI